VDAPDKAKTEQSSKAPKQAIHENRSAGADQARFSFDHTRVKKLEAMAMAQPEIRDQKVDAIRQAVGKGQYAVSDAQIAAAISADFGAGGR